MTICLGSLYFTHTTEKMSGLLDLGIDCAKVANTMKNLYESNTQGNIKPHMQPNTQGNIKPHMQPNTQGNIKPHMQPSTKGNIKPHIQQAMAKQFPYQG